MRISIVTADGRETMLAQGRDEADEQFRERVGLVIALQQGAEPLARSEPTAISLIRRAIQQR